MPPPVQLPPAPPRIAYLDSVRGLAALVVVVFHFLTWQWAATRKVELATLVFNGSSAVSVFFVLSGLVLSLKYFHPDEQQPIDGPHYLAFVANRVARIYLPYLAAFIGFYYVLFHWGEAPGALLRQLGSSQTPWVAEGLLIRGDHRVYGPGWSLEVELMGSLLLPFLVLLLRHSRPLFLMLLAVHVVLGPPLVPGLLLHFLLGMLLAYYFPRIAGYDLRASRLYRLRYLGYLLVFAALSFRHLARLFPLGPEGAYWLGLLRLDAFFFAALGAAGLLAYVINSPRLQRGLAARPLRFLGRISYSVYLVHWLFVSWGIKLLNAYLLRDASQQRLAIGEALAGVVLLTVLVATAFHALVERPCTRLGRRLAARLAGARPGPPVED
jgi:peptidoglycan/LPS O-acetylase OafA/YrhL